MICARTAVQDRCTESLIASAARIFNLKRRISPLIQTINHARNAKIQQIRIAKMDYALLAAQFKLLEETVQHMMKAFTVEASDN